MGKGSRKGTVRQHPSSTPVMSPVPVPAENDKTKHVAKSNSDWDRGQHELQKMACLIHVFVGGAYKIRLACPNLTLSKSLDKIRLKTLK